MNKCDILALINACQSKIEEIIDMNISEKNKKGFEELLHATEKHYNIVANAKDNDTKLFESYASLYSSLYYKLRTIDSKVYSENVGLALYTQLKKAERKDVAEPRKANNAEPSNVIDVKFEPVDEKKKNKTLGIIAGASCTIAALAIIMSLVKENNKLKNQLNNLDNDDPKEAQEIVIEEKPTAEIEEEITIEEPSDTIEIEPIEELNLSNIDINNEDDLYNYAEKLASTPGNTLTIEEIITALKLANFDDLENKSVFASREELYKANTDLGKLTTLVGTDKVEILHEENDIFVTEDTLKEMLACITNNELKLDNFSSLKEEKGYNIYKLYELCAKKLNDANEINKVLYAKLFNEMTARKFESFSLTPESPISQYYLMLGMFNENMNASLALTTNHGWGPTYGEMRDNNTVPNGYTGDEIDGSYGYICIEELIHHLTIGNPDYSMYSIYADEVMIDKGLSR